MPRPFQTLLPKALALALFSACMLAGEPAAIALSANPVVLPPDTQEQRAIAKPTPTPVARNRASTGVKAVGAQDWSVYTDWTPRPANAAGSGAAPSNDDEDDAPKAEAAKPVAPPVPPPTPPAALQVPAAAPVLTPPVVAPSTPNLQF